MIRVNREVIAKDDDDGADIVVSVLDEEDKGRHVSISGGGSATVWLSWTDLRTFAHALIELADSEAPDPFGERTDAHD